MAEGTPGLFDIEIETVISFQGGQLDYIVAVLNKELTILKYRNIFLFRFSCVWILSNSTSLSNLFQCPSKWQKVNCFVLSIKFYQLPNYLYSWLSDHANCQSVMDMVRKLALEFFTVCTKLAEMAILYSKDLTTAKKLPPLGLDLVQEIITGLGVQCLTIWAKQACAI